MGRSTDFPLFSFRSWYFIKISPFSWHSVDHVYAECLRHKFQTSIGNSVVTFDALSPADKFLSNRARIYANVVHMDLVVVKKAFLSIYERFRTRLEVSSGFEMVFNEI